MITLENCSIFHIMVYILRRIKDVHVLFTPQREEERKPLNIKKYFSEKLVFVFS